MRTLTLLLLGLAVSFACGQTVPAPVADDAPPTATGVNEVQRMEQEVQRVAADVQRLRQRLPDWAAISWYAEDDVRVMQRNDAKPRVVFLGDSITHNWGGEKVSSYFHHDHDKFIPINRGIGGQNVPQMLIRMRPDVIALKPGAMVIFAGTNDLATFKVPDLLGFIEGNFVSIFELAQANKIPVVVCSILPVNDVYQKRTEARPPDQILQLNGWLKDQAKQRGYEYVDFYNAVSDGKERLRAEITKDGLHPTAEGYVLMEPLVEKAIEKTLASDSHSAGSK